MAIVFNLKVLKSMTLSELSDRPEKLDGMNALLALDEYKLVYFFIMLNETTFMGFLKKVHKGIDQKETQLF